MKLKVQEKRNCVMKKTEMDIPLGESGNSFLSFLEYTIYDIQKPEARPCREEPLYFPE